MAYTKVKMIIRVPIGDMCWQREGDHSICEHFDNSDGVNYCQLLGTSLKPFGDEGVPKAQECLDFQEVEKYSDE